MNAAEGFREQRTKNTAEIPSGTWVGTWLPGKASCLKGSGRLEDCRLQGIVEVGRTRGSIVMAEVMLERSVGAESRL